jgi:hypothetical protein
MQILVTSTQRPTCMHELRGMGEWEYVWDSTLDSSKPSTISVQEGSKCESPCQNCEKQLSYKKKNLMFFWTCSDIQMNKVSMIKWRILH